MSFPSSGSFCCLAVCLAGLALDTNAQKLPTCSQDLLAMSFEERVRFLNATRPSPVRAGERARILASLPAEGEVLTKIGKPWWFGLTLSRDGRWLLFPTIDREGRDLYVVDGVR